MSEEGRAAVLSDLKADIDYFNGVTTGEPP
jgi:hypothetical protein